MASKNNNSFTRSYGIHGYETDEEGYFEELNFSTPRGEKTVMPDYWARRQDSDGFFDTWEITDSDGDIYELTVAHGIESKNLLAQRLDSMYRRIVDQSVE